MTTIEEPRRATDTQTDDACTIDRSPVIDTTIDRRPTVHDIGYAKHRKELGRIGLGLL